MARIVWMLVFVAAVVMPLPAQKKPDAKPESAPASQPAIPADPELQKELDSIATELSVKMNCVPGKTFDMAGTINPSQLTILMEVADRAFKMFEDITAGAGGVAGPSVTGAAPRPPGQTPANVLFDGRKCLIVIFNNTQQYNAFAKWYQTKYSWPVADAMKTVNYFPIAYPRCTIVSHLRPLDISMMRNVVAHEIGHMCAYRYAYNNNFSPDWFVEGLATCLEGKTCGTTSCYCFAGGYGDANAANKNLVNREWSKWKAAVKTLVNQKQDRAIDHIVPMLLKDLTMNETGKAMAMVDYWINTDPAKLTHWLALTKKYWPTTKPQESWEPAKGEAEKRALKEAWNMEWAEMDEAWRKYVQAKY